METDSHCYNNGHNSQSSGCNSRKSGHNTGCNSRAFSPPGSDFDNKSYFSQKGSNHINGYNSHNSGRNTGHNTGRNSRDTSPVHRDYDKNGHGFARDKKQGHYETDKARTSSKSSASERQSRTDLSQSQGSWHGSARSLLSPASPESSRNISPSRRSPTKTSSKPQVVSVETDKQINDRSRSTMRRGLEALILSENTRSTSQPAVPEMTIEDYVVIADIPRVNLYPEEEVVVRRRPQSRSPRRDDQHSSREGRDGDTYHGEQQERGRGRERGRERRDRDRRHHDRDAGGSSESNSNASGLAQKSREQNMSANRPEIKCNQPQMQGWMYLLDSSEEWRKFWFVLDDFGLKYYIDPEASEREEPDGLIDVQHSVRVVDFDADKNYGLQIHMRDGEVTLSAMTSRIRRNWIDILRRCIKPTDSSGVAQLPDGDSGSLKQKSLSQNASCRFSPSYPDLHDSGSEVTSPCQDEPDTMSSPLTNQREAGVGRDEDFERRLEDRTKWFQEVHSDKDGESPWDKVQLKKGSVSEAAD
ncbi:uncharacterized protein LOC143502015 isoform X2 [Brachyhypopomus gauderio]|uniref:uncharacterized protein LOC143502015 isoform X2 n=1 Tax=Brachyhypopomus gauderio TaxID=698409 RepID=UPI0040411AAC